MSVFDKVLSTERLHHVFWSIILDLFTMQSTFFCYKDGFGKMGLNLQNMFGEAFRFVLG